MHWLLCLLLLLSCQSHQERIRLKGSDTVLPVGQALAEAFLKQCGHCVVAVTGGGSGVGIQALIAGNTDIAMSSRPLKLSERLLLKNAQITCVEDTIALDALAVCVHPSNPVERLTQQQLKAIFTGKIKNWKEVGGKSMPIVVYSRESSSGTYEFFKEKVMEGEPYAPDVLMLPATGAVVQSVSQTPGAIGYIGLAYVNDKIKTIAVSYDNGKTYVKPTMQSAIEGRYPIVRPLYFFYDKKKVPFMKRFLDFCHSKTAAKIIQNIGYIPVYATP